MPSCFVMQPFDRSKFDKRYKDVFAPAIVDAGLEPYRVDNDPSVSIPIEDIERGIRRASVCFAEITLDNPNVWFELGYALSAGKELCIICSEERVGKLPFDVQHRNVINYAVGSPSDYDELRTKIIARLQALMHRVQAFETANPVSLLRDSEGLSQHELMVLTALAEIGDGMGSPVTHWSLQRQMEMLGNNNLALTVGVAKLARRSMVQVGRDEDQNGEPFTTYQISDAGVNWLVDNSDRLNFEKPKPARRSMKRAESSVDDDIPF